jgi:hypothetical protein
MVQMRTVFSSSARQIPPHISAAVPSSSSTDTEDFFGRLRPKPAGNKDKPQLLPAF